MTMASMLSGFVTLNLLLVAAFCVLRGVSWLARRIAGAGLAVAAKEELRVHYFTLAACLAFTILSAAIETRPVFEPVVKLWAASSPQAFAGEGQGSGIDPQPAATVGSAAMVLDYNAGKSAVAGFLGLSIMWGMIRLGLDLRSLARIRMRAFVMRRIGGVVVLVSDQIAIPFSFWLPGRAMIVVPMDLVSRQADCRVAIFHELQHHRQRDTMWLYLILGLSALCVFNPVVRLWSRWISEIQEFACDETLVGRKKVDSRHYARCLVEVAETALNQSRSPVCATGLAFLAGQNLLRRRIEMLLSPQKNTVRSLAFSRGLAAVAFAGLLFTAIASHGLVQDRRVTLKEAQKMAARAQGDTEFPVVVNDLVLKELNRYLGTPVGREYMRKALRSLEQYQPMVETKVVEYRLPRELMAIPMMESGYQNLPQIEHKAWGAGIWMFIESTARTYGLRVDEKVDERLNPQLETDAAMRYLKSNWLMFKDWHLAVLAYNTGERAIQEGIRKYGTRDAWELTRKGVENDGRYLAKVMAAVLIFKNPDSVE